MKVKVVTDEGIRKDGVLYNKGDYIFLPKPLADDFEKKGIVSFVDEKPKKVKKKKSPILFGKSEKEDEVKEEDSDAKFE